LFASSWYIFLTYIYDARSHLYQIFLYGSFNRNLNLRLVQVVSSRQVFRLQDDSDDTDRKWWTSDKFTSQSCDVFFFEIRKNKR